MEDTDLMIGGRYTLDTSSLDISIKEARRQLSLLQSSTKTALSGMDDWANSVDGLTTKLESLRKQLQLQGQVVAQYQARLDSLLASENRNQGAIDEARKNLDRAQQSYNRTQRSIRQYETSLSQIQAQEKKHGVSIKGVISGFSSLQSVLVGAGVIAAIRAVGTALADSVKDFMEYQDVFSEVRKTVDGSEEDFEALNSEIQKMARNMPQSASEIAKVVALGAQLGVSMDALTDFSRVMIQLGDSTDLTAESAGEMIAQIGAISGLKPEDYERFGSAIVALGNSSSATESAILEMASRITRFGTGVGLSATDTLALSSALASMGVQAEAGSSAIQRLFSDMQLAIAGGGEELSAFAEVAGMTGADFAIAFEKDALSAFMAFIAGIRRLSSQGQSAVETLSALGITEVQTTATVQALASGYDTLTSSITTAQTAWTENSALEVEATARYSNLSSQITITGNKITELTRRVGGALAPAVTTVVQKVGDLAEWLTQIRDLSAQSQGKLSDFQRALEAYGDAAEAAGEQISGMASAQKIAAMATLESALSEVVLSWKELRGVSQQAGQTQWGLFGDETIVEHAQALADVFVQEAQKMAPAVSTVGEALRILEMATEAHVEGVEDLQKAYDDYSSVLAAAKQEPEEGNAAAAQMTATEEMLAQAALENANLLPMITSLNADLGAAVAALIPKLQAEAAAEEQAVAIRRQAEQDFQRRIELLKNQTDSEEALRTALLAQEKQYTLNGATVGNTAEETAYYAEIVRLTKEALEEMSEAGEKATVSIADLSTYIQKYGTDAEKLELQISNLEKELEDLFAVRAGETDLIDPDIDKKIELAERGLASLNADLEALGHESGKSWLDAVIDEMTGGSGELAQKVNQAFSPIVSTVQDLFSQTVSVVSGFLDNALTEVESELDTLDEMLKSRQQAIDDSLDDRQKALEDALYRGEITEADYYREVAKAQAEAEAKKRAEQEASAQKEEELLRKKNELQRAQFNAEKANNIASVVMETALAIMQGYAQMGPIAGSVYAGILAALGAAQVVQISQQKYVPALASGGITTGPTYALIGDNPSGREAVIPLESGAMRLFADELLFAMERRQGSVYNTQKTDSRSWTINQNITPGGNPSRREIYLQTRRALKEARS